MHSDQRDECGSERRRSGHTIDNSVKPRCDVPDAATAPADSYCGRDGRTNMRDRGVIRYTVSTPVLAINFLIVLFVFLYHTFDKAFDYLCGKSQ